MQLQPSPPSALTALSAASNLQPGAAVASLHGVSKAYPLGRVNVPALSEINLNIRPQSFTLIVGPSGSGKTTALNLLGAIDSPDQGTVSLLGQPLQSLSDDQLSDFRNRHIGYIFQSFNLIPVLDVFENVEFPLLLQNLPKKRRREMVRETLAAVGLEARSRHRPNELSGGQRQRVAVARALVKRPKLVLADEPTANLDSDTSREIITLMHRMQEHFHSTFIFSTHDPELMDHADDVITLLDGRVTRDGIRTPRQPDRHASIRRTTLQPEGQTVKPIPPRANTQEALL